MYKNDPFGEIAIRCGLSVPTGTVGILDIKVNTPAVLIENVAARLLPLQATYNREPFGEMANPSGFKQVTPVGTGTPRDVNVPSVAISNPESVLLVEFAT